MDSRGHPHLLLRRPGKALSTPRRWARLEALRGAGVDPYPGRSGRTHTVAQLVEALACAPAGPSCGAPVLDGAAQTATLAGRLTRLSPPEITDATGSLTLPVGTALAAHLRVGDLICATVQASGQAPAQVTLLAPSLDPAGAQPGLPWRARAPGGGATLQTLTRRSQLLHALRTFFLGQGFIEVETPAMAATPGMEPHLDPFQTQWQAFPGAEGSPRYLLTSPEYAMKRLVVAGLERVFQVSRVFRNGEAGPFHNPEFTMVEWYRAHASYLDILVDTQDLILHMARAAGLGLELQRGAFRIDLSPPWQRLTVSDAVARYAGIDLGSCVEAGQLAAAARAAGVQVPEGSPWDETFFRILMEKVEPKLGFERPTFLMDYPAPLAALARVTDGPAPVAERFELYIAGVEIANAFTELNDPQAQAARFEEERQLRATLGAPVFDVDRAYLAALEQGLPPTGGIALGVDRLVMTLLNLPDLRQAIAFPVEL